MIDNPVYDDNLVRGSDLQPIIDQLNAQEVFVDDLTMISTESTAGKYLSVIDQYGGGSGGGGGDTVAFAPAVIVSGSNGVYVCNIVNDDGSISTDETLLVASRATAYDLAADKQILGGYFPTVTA